MIDSALLRELGWTSELIEAVTRVAGSLHHAPTSGIAIPSAKVHSLSCTAMYSDVVVNNTAREITVPTPDEREAGSENKS